MTTGESHVRPLREESWSAAEAIALELSGRGTDVNEIQKVVTHARVQAERNPERVGEDFFTLLDTMVRDGRHLVRSHQTLDYYRNLSDTCNRHLRDFRRTTIESGWELVGILGWAARLMRYYNTPEGKAELTSKQRGVERRERSDDSAASSTPLRQTEVARDEPRPRRPTPQVAPPKARPRQETAREPVTLLSEVKAGKARVRTERGEELTCTGLPSYPRASPGEVCRADVTREDGRAVKAFFKGWVS
jgi:hypothetical protein